jgi:hypothetical protein
MELEGSRIRFHPSPHYPIQLKRRAISRYHLDVLMRLRIPLAVLLFDGPESTIQIDAIPPAALMYQEIVLCHHGRSLIHAEC